MSAESSKRIARELLRAIRGARSQGYMNRRLGFRFNKYAKWENGYSTASWSDFLKASEAVSLDPGKSLERLIGYAGDPGDTPTLVKLLLFDRSISDVAKQLGCSKSLVSGFVRGRAEPKLHHILGLVDAAGELSSWISNLVEINDIPALADEHRLNREYRKLVSARPMAALALGYLRLERYKKLRRHDHAKIGKDLRITAEESRELYLALLKAGLIAEKTGGKYAPLTQNEPNTGGRDMTDYLESLAVKRFWTQESLRFIDEQRQGIPKSARGEKRFGYQTLALSEKAEKLLNDKLADLFYSLRDLEAPELGEKTRLLVFTMGLLKMT